MIDLDILHVERNLRGMLITPAAYSRHLPVSISMWMLTFSSLIILNLVPFVGSRALGRH